MPSDRRYARNCDRLRALFQKIIDERRSGKSHSYDDSTDLLQILISTEPYASDDEAVKDEIFGFFFAGMKTIQITTTNLIYYLELYPEIKQKLMSEIRPVCEKHDNNLVEGLDYDTVMELDYLQQCYYESMRIEAPAAGTV